MDAELASVVLVASEDQSELPISPRTLASARLEVAQGGGGFGAAFSGTAGTIHSRRLWNGS